MHAHIISDNQMKSTVQWFQQRHTNVNKHTAKARFSKLDIQSPLMISAAVVGPRFLWFLAYLLLKLFAVVIHILILNILHVQ